ncbi:recombinase family protein [Streptomyces sp. NPDC058674]|uniref:recombinase family protein n=1 Tax=Streptomyces sp. NPDC058674 TaxID=3346592 RepID=UPI00365FDE1A
MKIAGRTARRPPGPSLAPGDTLVVPALDRYGRSLQDLIAMVGELRKREIGFTSLHENLDTTTPGGRLVFHVFAALAEFIRELIVSGTREGLAAARARGKVGGRPSVVNADIIRAARDMLPNPDHSIASIAKLLGVSPGTLYNHIPDLQELRVAAFRHSSKRAPGDPRTAPDEGRSPPVRSRDRSGRTGRRARPGRGCFRRTALVIRQDHPTAPSGLALAEPQPRPQPRCLG